MTTRVGVGHDIDQALLAELVEPRLLSLDLFLVLDEGRRNLAIGSVTCGWFWR